MSGPIVRKYGFPNFEQIFGKREPQHGVEGEEPPYQAVAPAAPLASDAPGHAATVPPADPATAPPAANPNDPAGRATTTAVSPPTELGGAIG